VPRAGRSAGHILSLEIFQDVWVECRHRVEFFQRRWLDIDLGVLELTSVCVCVCVCVNSFELCATQAMNSEQLVCLSTGSVVTVPESTVSEKYDMQ
jgi:hypothetical protein